MVAINCMLQDKIIISLRLHPVRGMEDLSKAVQALAAAVVSVAIAASVSYETGYFSIVGQKYQALLSVSDYLSSALEWLPWLSLLYGLGFLIAYVGSFAQLNILRRIYEFQPIALIATTAIVAVGICLLLVFIPFYRLLLHMPLVALPLVATPLFLQLSKAARAAKKLSAIAVSSIAVMLALYCSGIGYAHRDLQTIGNAYVIRSGADGEGAQVLRTLQKGLLVWKPQDSKVDLIGWNKIDRMTHLIWKSYDAPWFEPLGCHIWESLCHRQPPSP